MAVLCKKDSAHTVVRNVLNSYIVPNIGITVTIVDSATELKCKECDEVLDTDTPDIPGLIAATAIARIKLPIKLQGGECQFLRKAIGYSARELSDILSVTPETVSRWENDKAPIGPASEKLLRLLVGLELSDQAPGVDYEVDEIINMKVQALRPSSEPIDLRFKRGIVKLGKGKTEEKYTDIDLAA